MVYRRAYGWTRDVIHRAGAYADPLAVPIDPTEAAGPLDDGVRQNPEVWEAVADAIADARAGRRPRW
jgi:hypothetical protein